MRKLLLLSCLGVSACVNPNDAGICVASEEDVATLRKELENHPETPDAVGEAGTEVVMGLEGACGFRR